MECLSWVCYSSILDGVMGNAPLCISRRAEGVGLSEYSYPDYMLVPGPSLRCLSESPELQAGCGEGEREEEGGEGVRGRGVWWSEDWEQWEGEERECDMILGLELLQDSVSLPLWANL